MRQEKVFLWCDMEDVYEATRQNDATRLSSLVHTSKTKVLDAEDAEGKTPVTIAVENNSTDCVKWLVDNGCRLAKTIGFVADPDSVNASVVMQPPPEVRLEADNADSFYPPLLAAVACHSHELAALLLDTGRVQIEDGYKGRTALIQACAEGYADMVTLLISHGANVNGWAEYDNYHPYDSEQKDPTVWEYRPLYHAVQHDHGDVVDILARKGARYIAHCPIPCYSFWQPHSWSSPNNILQRCWGSVLELAVLKCRSKVTFLLDFYCNDVTTLEAFQTLVQCIVADDLELTEVLLDACLQRTAHQHPPQQEHHCNDSFLTVIKFAVRKCHEGKENIPLLLLERSGSLVDDATLLILLDLAVLRNLSQVVAKLAEIVESPSHKEALGSDSDIDILRTVRLQDVTYTALSQGNLSIIQTLVGKGLMDLKGQPNVLFEVLSPHGGCTDIGKLLSWLVVEQGFDPRACNKHCLEPIHVAVKEQMPEAINTLCLLGVDANVQAVVEDLLSPLQMHLNLCVLQLGINPNMRLMEVLIEHGADLTMKNKQGYTPLSLLFWLVLARKHDAVRQRASLNPCYQHATINTMKYFPLNAAFVLTDPPPAHDEYSSSSSEEEDSSEEEGSSDESDEDSDTSSAGSFVAMPTPSRSSRRVRGNSTTSCAHIPLYLQADKPQRPFIKQVVTKFGLGLLSMGADTLIGAKRWHHMDRYLLLAGIHSKHTPSLKSLCWRGVRKSLGSVRFQHKVDQLPLPSVMKDFLKKL